MPGDVTFLGEFKHTLDSQRRVAVPRGWRSGDKSCFYLFPGRGGCLQLISQSVFADLTERIRKVSFTDPVVSRALAKIGALAQECVCDKQGRIAIPQKLKEFAGIDGEVMMVGAITTGQIWAAQAWEAESEDPEKLLDVIDGLFGGGDNILDVLKGLGK